MNRGSMFIGVGTSTVNRGSQGVYGSGTGMRSGCVVGRSNNVVIGTGTGDEKTGSGCIYVVACI